MTLAPIILFVYNRPWHTEQTLRALMANDLTAESELYIYADGPKPNATDEQLQKIREVRQVIRKEQWCGKVHIVESEKNKGLADSIIGGVTEIVNKYGKIIVLEDDIVPTTGFLRYMNDALEMYKDDKQVMQVSGYIYPYTKVPKIPTTYFLRIMACWGWGTWKRAWDYYEHDIDIHLSHFNTPKLQKKFDVEGHMKNYCQLQNNKNGTYYTWAVRWYASWVYAGGFSLFPSQSLVYNAGFDDSGEHCGASQVNYNQIVINDMSIYKISMVENRCVRFDIDRAFKRMYGPKNFHQYVGRIAMKLGIYDFLRKIWDFVKK